MPSAFEYARKDQRSNRILCNKMLQGKQLLGIDIRNKLKFDVQVVGRSCQRANRELNVLQRITNKKLPKRHVLQDEFFKSQFNQCPTF